MNDWTEKPQTYAEALDNLTEENFHRERELIEQEMERTQAVVEEMLTVDPETGLTRLAEIARFLDEQDCGAMEDRQRELIGWLGEWTKRLREGRA